MAGQVRMEELLAKAVTVDVRKEWYCRSRTETNVWTISTCRRCQDSVAREVQVRRLKGGVRPVGSRVLVFLNLFSIF